MNFAQLRDAVRERCGLTATDQMATATNMGAVVNAALHELEARKPSGWPWNLSTVPFTLTAGTQAYEFTDFAAVGTEIVKIRNVYMLIGTTNQRLEPMGSDALLNTYPTAVPQVPAAWATDGYFLLFGPPPNDAWVTTIQVVLAEPDLVADGDTPRMPNIFHQALVEQAAGIQYRRLGKPNDANLALQAAGQIVTTMMSYSRTRTGPGRLFIRDPNE